MAVTGAGHAAQVTVPVSAQSKEARDGPVACGVWSQVSPGEQSTVSG